MKVALTACVHKLLLLLNTIVHAGTPWRQSAAVAGAADSPGGTRGGRGSWGRGFRSSSW
jgi:hypothetical protein